MGVWRPCGPGELSLDWRPFLSCCLRFSEAIVRASKRQEKSLPAMNGLTRHERKKRTESVPQGSKPIVYGPIEPRTKMGTYVKKQLSVSDCQRFVHGWIYYLTGTLVNPSGRVTRVKSLTESCLDSIAYKNKERCLLLSYEHCSFLSSDYFFPHFFLAAHFFFLGF